ncbi:methyltransferase domain-containing protein [Phlyctema vagabunda]|uniref:Methyltransferase domain-containing protein n=1 Tax=Phlyctema vagabunda TaxID=108571 RepID=A0ABR4PSB1_9HELO
MDADTDPPHGDYSEPGPQQHQNLDIPTTMAASSTPSIHSTGLHVDLDWDADSAIGTLGSENSLMSTQSVRPSVYDYVQENGRRYHRFKEGVYLGPNDEAEQDRLDLQHHLFLLGGDHRLNFAPIEDIEGGMHTALDIGTGTGIWAMEFATAFPNVSVIGTDLSPIQPEYVPQNCQFEIDDAEDQWTFTQKFDYIHGRALFSSFRSHSSVFQSAFEHLQPGGWLEMQDAAFPFRCIDDSMRGTAFERWSGMLLSAAQALGRDFQVVPKYKRLMEEAGFVDVVEKQMAWPIGSWAKGEKMKMIGMYCKEDVLQGLPAWSMAAFTRGLGMEYTEVEKLIFDVQAEIREKGLHCYVPV